METVNDKKSTYNDFFDVKPTTSRKPPTLSPSSQSPQKTSSVLKKPIAKTEKPPQLTPWIKNKPPARPAQIEEILPTFQQKTSTLNTQIPSSDSLTICAWNINGLRPITEKGYLQNYIKERQPDIMCLCETKCSQDSIDSNKLTGWIPYYYPYRYFNTAKIKKGCHGTGIITKQKPLSVEYGIGLERFDPDGRSITLEYEAFYIVNVYVPNSSDDFCNLADRIREWDPAFRTYLTKLKAKKPVILCGDLNVIHRVIDLAILKELGKVAGSHEEEKNNFNSLLKTGFVDTYRTFYPQKQKYTWWNFKRPKQRGEGKGRRYDYVLVSDEILKNVEKAFIDDHVYGSDHCPVGIVFKPSGAVLSPRVPADEDLEGIKTPPIDEYGNIISDDDENEAQSKVQNNDVICIDSD